MKDLPSINTLCHDNVTAIFTWYYDDMPTVFLVNDPAYAARIYDAINRAVDIWGVEMEEADEGGDTSIYDMCPGDYVAEQFSMAGIPEAAFTEICSEDETYFEYGSRGDEAWNRFATDVQRHIPYVTAAGWA